jgi:hypothetical protein
VYHQRASVSIEQGVRSISAQLQLTGCHIDGHVPVVTGQDVAEIAGMVLSGPRSSVVGAGWVEVRSSRFKAGRFALTDFMHVHPELLAGR